MTRPPATTTLRCNLLLGSVEDACSALRRALDTDPNVARMALLSRVHVRPHALVAGVVEIVRSNAGGPRPDVRHTGPRAAGPTPRRGPDADAAATVYVAARCGESVLRGADVYPPGVLDAAHAPGCPAGANPDPGTTGRTAPRLGDEAACACLRAGASVALVVRVRPRRDGRPDVGLTSSRRALGRGVVRADGSVRPVRARAPDGSFGMSRNFAPPVPLASLLATRPLRRRLFPQNLPCTLCAQVLAPEPHDWTLDLCAGPGGKTSHLAMLMRDRGRVLALDASRPRAAAVATLCARMGLTCVASAHMDARTLTPETAARAMRARRAGTERPRGDGGGLREASGQAVSGQAKPRALFDRALFDRALVDPPCSGLGDRPRFRQGRSLGALRALVPHQRRLIRAAARCLKRPGGTMVYSTCTVNVDENEAQVRWVLDTFPWLRLERQRPCLHGTLSRPGLRGCGLSEAERRLVQRFDPHGPGDSVGFFMAKFVAIQ
jgi:16S rRNA C967 or C1407 C5-methylase (RsmB/RsmF family)